MLAVRLSLVALAAGSLAVTSPALAAWRSEDVPGTAGALAPLTLGVDRDGRALMLFEGFQQQRSPQKFTGVATRVPQGAWARRDDLTGIGWGAAHALLYGRTRALVVTRRGDRLVWAVGRTDGSFGAFRRIAAGVGAHASAVDPSGDALVAYTPRAGGGVRVSERRAGGGFAAPRRFSRTAGAVPAVAINPRGDRLVAWFGPRGLRVKLRRAGTGWSSAQTLSSDRGGPNTALRAAVSANGRFVLAWETVDIREDVPVRLTASVAVRPGGGRWNRASLERATLATESFAADPAAIPFFDSGGRLLVAYTAARGRGTAVELAGVSEAARLTATTGPSGPSTTATLDDAAAGEGGRVAVSWAEHRPGGEVHTFAALRPGAGAFEAPADLTRPGEIGVTGSRVALSPATGEALVVRTFVAGGTSALAATGSDAGARR